MNFLLTDEQNDLIKAIRKTINNFDDHYWLNVDKKSDFPKTNLETLRLFKENH